MARKTIVWDSEGNRTEVDRQIVGENLSEDMRRLPGDYVTRDIGDPDRVHKHDPANAREDIVKDRVIKEVLGMEAHEAVEQANARVAASGDGVDGAKAKAKLLSCAPIGARVPLTQWEVDIVRMRVLVTLIEGWRAQMERDGGAVIPPTQHLWFPEDNVNEYELRIGNAPASSVRPKHLKRLQLFIDVLQWPQSILNFFEERGAKIPDLKTLAREMGVEA